MMFENSFTLDKSLHALAFDVFTALFDRDFTALGIWCLQSGRFGVEKEIVLDWKEMQQLKYQVGTLCS